MNVEMRKHGNQTILMVALDRGLIRTLFNLKPVMKIFTSTDNITWVNEITGKTLNSDVLKDFNDILLINEAISQHKNDKESADREEIECQMIEELCEELCDLLDEMEEE